MIRAILEQTTLGVWAIDADARTTFANDRMAELLATTPEAMAGRRIYEFIDAAAGEVTRAALERRRAGVSELRELTLNRRDGRAIEILMEATPLVDEAGRYLGSVAVVDDITQRKQIEREVSMLAALVRSSSDAIVACSLDGSIQSWNPAAEVVFGFAREEVLGRPLSLLLDAAGETVVKLLDTAAAGELVGPLEIDGVAKDRTRLPVELTACPVDDGLGRTTMVAVTMRDIRERIEAERIVREVERARTDVEKVGRTGTFELCLDTGDMIWSDEVWRIHGRAPATAKTPRYATTVHPGDREIVRGVAEKLATSSRSVDVRYRIVQPAGAIRWVQAHAERVAGSDERRVIGTIRDVTELVEAEEQARAALAELNHQTVHDRLTGLPKRSLLLERIGAGLAHADRQRSAVAVLVADIDRFGLVNQELGHSFGDQLLYAVGQRLVAIMRTGDTIGHIAGDEFAVVCESVDPQREAIDALAARVLDAFAEPFEVGGQEIFLVSSVGATWATGAEPAEALLARATAAVQSAKERERGSFVVVRPDGAAAHGVRGNLALRQALREAIGSDQLRVVYQPIVDLRTSAQRGLEALLRWEHPGLGPVSPLEFIPVAEDTGLIIPIGGWVLEEACRTIAALDGALSVSVNLSPRQLLQPDLPAVVRSALRESGVQPRRLVLELTESILVEESERVGRALDELKQIGVRLALDDFGTGYSALSYLKRFPFDIVKVDRSFVRGLGQDSGDGAIVGAVLGMARALGMEVVAEGIETEEQLACLHELGAEYGQGYYFARPGPV